MNNIPPITEPAGDIWPNSWREWLGSVWSCLSGWKRTWNKNVTYDFGSCAANTTTTGTTVTITGVRSTDGVQITAAAKTTGIVYDAAVTANDTVTIYANNVTTGPINPASTTFRIIVFQN